MEIRIIGTPEEIESVKQHIAEKYEIYRKTGLYECSTKRFKKYTSVKYHPDEYRKYLNIKAKEQEGGE